MSIFESKYFMVMLIENKPRTSVYGVYSKHHGDLISIVKWYAPWRQYCNFPEPETVWTRSCHCDINRFIDKLMATRKKKAEATA